MLGRMEGGQGRAGDIDLLQEVGHNMLFRAFCALADGAVSPIDSSIKYFRDEYEEHVRLGRCPFREDETVPPEPETPQPVAFPEHRPLVELGEVLG
jgi:hypothetical protein